MVQSQSRSNDLASPKSSIRSRRSRRNRAAQRLNREEDGAGGQETSSPSLATSQSRNFTHAHNDSLLASNQPQPVHLGREDEVQPRLVSRLRSRRLTHATASQVARTDILQNQLHYAAEPLRTSPDPVSFYGYQTHQTCQSNNHTPDIGSCGLKRELSPK